MNERAPSAEVARTGPHIELSQRLPFAGLFVLLLFAIFLPDRVWNTLLLGLTGLIAVAYYWARQMAKGLSATRKLRYGWVGVGDRLSEQFEIQNQSWLPALWVEVVDESNVPGYRAAVVRSISPQTVDRWRQTAICRQRGQYLLGPWKLQSADPFGLFRVTIPYGPGGEIIIHPPIHTGIPIALPAGQSKGQARTRDHSWQATINAASVRDYHAQDPLSWIHWPTTARQDALYVRQFDLDAAGDIWFIVDMQQKVQLGSGLDGTEEHAVLLAAALSFQALRRNRAAGVAAYGREPQVVIPGLGQGQQWKLLRALALTRADADHDLALTLKDVGHVARRGSAAVIITPTNQLDWLPGLMHLTRQGIQTRVVLLDRASFIDRREEGTSSTITLRDTIRQMGVETYLIARGAAGAPIEERERHGFWEFKVTGTGKVVTVRKPGE